MTRQTGTCTPAASHGEIVSWLHDPLVITFDGPPRGGDGAGPLLAVPVIPARDYLATSRVQVTVIDDSISMRR